MKYLLIAVNLILAFILCAGAIRFFKNAAKEKKQAYTVVRRAGSGKNLLQKKTKYPEKPIFVSSGKITEQQPADSEKILKANIFNQDRCPNSGIGARSARVEMTLVGTFSIGKHSGAIILQKNQTRNFSFFGPPSGNAGPQGGFGRRQQGFVRNGNSGTETARMNGFRQGNNMNFGGRQPVGGTLNGNETSYKQFVRIGETLSNGYKLLAITRTAATLSRGGDKLELELQEASKNAPKNTSQGNGRINGRQMMQQFLQGIQNMQRMQGFQNMQNMQMMRQMMQNNNTGNGVQSSTRSSRARR